MSIDVEVSRCSVVPESRVASELPRPEKTSACLNRLVEKVWFCVKFIFLRLRRLCCKAISPLARFLLPKLEKDEAVLASILENSKKYCDSPDFLPYYYCCRLLLLSEGQAARLLPKLLHAELEWVGDASPSQRASAILRAALDENFVSTFVTLIAKERVEEVQSRLEAGIEMYEREFLAILIEEKLATSWLNSRRTGLFHFQNVLVESFLGIDVGIDISLPSREGNTALHFIKSSKFAEKLIERAPSALNVENNRGETPLEIALVGAISARWPERKESLKLVQVFLKQGARFPPDENHILLREGLKAIRLEYSFGLSAALDWLTKEGIDWQSVTSPAELLKAVMDSAADGNHCEDSGLVLLDHLLAAGVAFVQDSEGNTPLHLITDLEVVDLLIKRVPSLLEIRNNRGETPFESALGRAISAPRLERRDSLRLVQVFLSQGAVLLPDKNHTLLKEFLKGIVESHPRKLTDMMRQLIDRGIDWQSCVSAGDLLRGVMDTVAPEFTNKIEPSVLIDLLFGMSVELDLEGLRGVLLDSVHGLDIDIDATCTLVRLLEEKKQGIIRDCDPEGEILWSLMNRIARGNPYPGRFEEISLVKELLDSGLNLDGGKLVDLLGQILDRYILDRHMWCGACRELIQLFQEKREGLIEAHDPNQTLVGCLSNKFFEGHRSPSLEWAGLLLDLGFKPDEAFLGNFLVSVLVTKNLPEGIERICERLIEAQSLQEEGLASAFFVGVVVENMLAQADLDRVLEERPGDLNRVRRSQLRLQILKSLIDKGAGIPDEVNGVPFSALLNPDTLPEEALALIEFVRRNKMTKSARGR